jgi:hypothetical protein
MPITQWGSPSTFGWELDGHSDKLFAQVTMILGEMQDLDDPFPVERSRCTVLVNNQVDNHVVAQQRPRRDPLNSGGRTNSLLGALFAGALLMLDHAHEVLGRASNTSVSS